MLLLRLTDKLHPRVLGTGCGFDSWSQLIASSKINMVLEFDQLVFRIRDKWKGAVHCGNPGE